ncbi:oleate-induced peroxisomal protein [Verticillium dahliae VdLs.17]|uniref:Oleate-induced peroxisomal protein n=1 Tax=Verticillium dahliae (strain VdLs.17 / ATCC MYA-4575 / FGSC 10137) TaxID=498257 RepID=G2WRF4_VERDV|nr:oleate-induced peroxisomal protein [Verticillium dahliae VdLs.17]EGY13455.1 oleate-induced peroxisomal protein [Verticillium dahliae VdLs.17]
MVARGPCTTASLLPSCSFRSLVLTAVSNGETRARADGGDRGSHATGIVTTSKFPSSAAFDAINSALSSEADRKDAIKQGNAVFAFTLKNSAGETDSWHIDLKETGTVQKGLPSKPTVTLSLSDADFASLVAGKANAQKL